MKDCAYSAEMEELKAFLLVKLGKKALGGQQKQWIETGKKILCKWEKEGLLADIGRDESVLRTLNIRAESQA